MTDRGENGLLLLPGLALLALGFLLPILRLMLLGFTGPEGATLAPLLRVIADSYYVGVLWRTVWLSLIITVICAVIGFPLAYMIARGGPRLRFWLLVMVVLPLMTSVVIRTFGWMVMLGRTGLIPVTLRDLGLVGRQFSLMHTETAIVLGMAQVLLPFMVLSVLGVILRIDPRLEEASRTMGASFMGSVRHVVLPLALPGIVAGSLLCFTLSASSFVTPNLLGGSRIQMLASSIYSSVTQTLDWPFAAAQATILFVGVMLVLIPYLRLTRRAHG